MLPRRHRLRKAGDFARVRKEGRAWGHPWLVVAAVPTGEPVTRFGFSVSKRVGKACARNRVRRLLCEAVRACLPAVQPGHDVVITSRPALAGQPFEAVRAAVCRQLRQARVLEAP